MNTSLDQQAKRLQIVADENKKKVYIFELQNGNRFETFDIHMRGQKISGSKVSKLVAVISPKKGANNEQA